MFAFEHGIPITGADRAREGALARFSRIIHVARNLRVTQVLMSLLQQFFRDIRYGARLLRRNMIFTATAVLSLALGIGGATAVFTLVNAVVLRKLPVPRASELYQAKTNA